MSGKKNWDWDKERAIRLLQEGETPANVAEMVGVSVATINRLKSQNGLTKPRAHAAPPGAAPAAAAPEEPPAPVEETTDERTQPDRPRYDTVDIRMAFRGWSVALNAPNQAKAMEAIRQLERAVTGLWNGENF